MSTADAPDAQIQSIIDGLSDVLLNTLHRVIESTVFTEYQSGNNDQILQLNWYPIISVTRVSVDNGGYFGQSPGAFPASGDLVQGVDYAIMSGTKGIGSTGCLRRLGATWYRRPTYEMGKIALQQGQPSGNILVSYTAGYTVVPAGIVYLINAAVARGVAGAAAGGYAQSASYEDASQSMFSAADMIQLFGSIERSLGGYKRIAV